MGSWWCAPTEIKTDADYARLDWLAKHYAIPVLLSVSLIQAFRQLATTGAASAPLLVLMTPL